MENRMTESIIKTSHGWMGNSKKLLLEMFAINGSLLYIIQMFTSFVD